MPADHWQDVTVTDPDRLTEVEAQIHDCPFGPDEVAFDRLGRTLTVAFRRYGFDDERRVGGTPVRADYEFPWRRSFLRIDHAKDYRVDDRARIGEAELVPLRYDAAAATDTLDSTPDHEIEVDVEELRVSVEHTAEILGRGRRSAWFDFVYSYDNEVRPA